MFKHAQSENFKWWNGYTNKLVVHVEEMDDKVKMPPGRFTDFVDVMKFKGEKKGSVTRDVRPLIIFFTSNKSPEVIYAGDWDNAMKSRFSLERLTTKTPDGHVWSQDLIFNISTYADFEKA